MQDPSEFQIKVRVSEDWVNSVIASQQVQLEIREGYVLGNLKVRLASDHILVTADLVTKPGTTVLIAGRVYWNSETQSISLEDLEVQLDTRNLLLKGASWVADNFLQSKIDREIENRLNERIRLETSKWIDRVVNIPVRQEGFVKVEVKSIHIHSLVLLEQHGEALVSVAGNLAVELVNDPDKGHPNI